MSSGPAAGPDGSFGPVRETTVGGVLREAAERAAGMAALVEGTADRRERRRWSYGELLSDSERVARALLGRFAPGERVAVWAPNCPEWVLLEFGAALAGLTLVTVSPALRTREVGYVLGQSRAHGVVHAPAYRGADLAKALEEVRGGLPGLREVISLADWDAFIRSGSATQRLPEVAPDAPAQIQYTSGTTGFPKGAVLRHRGITNNGRFCAQILQAQPGDVWVNPMPLFHTAGCVLLTLGPVQQLATQVVTPFEPGLVLNLLESERSALFGGVPTMILGLLGHPGFAGTDLASLRVAFAGGATIPPALVERVESALGIPFSITFAQTEASPCITQTRPGDQAGDRARTLGRPHPHVEVRITDPVTGQAVPAGTVGEILARGYNVMPGYFDNPAATAAAIDADGWLHTGDLGSADERGYYRIEGPAQGNDHPRGREYLPAGDRADPVRPSRGGRRGRGGRARRPLGRAGRRVHQARPGAQRHRGRADGLLPRAPGRPQDTAPLGFHRRLPADRVGQDPEVPAPRGVHLRPGTGSTTSRRQGALAGEGMLHRPTRATLTPAAAFPGSTGQGGADDPQERVMTTLRAPVSSAREKVS